MTSSTRGAANRSTKHQSISCTQTSKDQHIIRLHPQQQHTLHHRWGRNSLPTSSAIRSTRWPTKRLSISLRMCCTQAAGAAPRPSSTYATAHSPPPSTGAQSSPTSSSPIPINEYSIVGVLTRYNVEADTYHKTSHKLSYPGE